MLPVRLHFMYVYMIKIALVCCFYSCSFSNTKYKQISSNLISIPKVLIITCGQSIAAAYLVLTEWKYIIIKEYVQLVYIGMLTYKMPCTAKIKWATI